MNNKKLENIVKFCKKKGFFFQTAKLYGGIEGVFDYGTLGVEIKNNLRSLGGYP